jgi:hypothetical protein
MKIYISIYTNSSFVIILLTGSRMERHLEKCLSVISGLSVSPSLINLPMALQTKHVRKKKNTILFRWQFPRYNLAYHR